MKIERHIVALSGGKDSAAMAIHLAPKIPNLELVFCDTGRELPEVYELLSQIEKHLQRPVKRIQYCGRDFDWRLREYSYYLPSAQNRWCTKDLKIMPFERYLGKQAVKHIYIGLRADEDRVGNYGLRLDCQYHYPLRDDGLTKRDVINTLKGAGLELPAFYKWRSTGGCWCCPFQRKSDWMGLKLHHINLFQKALEDERQSKEIGRAFYWREGRPLTQIEAAWQPPLESDIDEWEREMPCLICAK